MTEFCTKSKTGFSRLWIWCGPIWAVKRFVWLVIRLLVWVAFWWFTKQSLIKLKSRKLKTIAEREVGDL